MQSILERLRHSSSPPDIFGLHGASAALLLSRAAVFLQRTLCCLLPSDDLLEPFAQDIAFFSDLRVVIHPSYEIPPYAPLSPDPATVCTRLATLYQLQEKNGEPGIVLTSAEAMLRRVLPARALSDHCELVIAGEETDRDGLVASLVASGYQMCEMVRQEGDLSTRGGIVDVYPPGLDTAAVGPIRLDFFGDTLESIRTFDPLTQRSRQEIGEAVLVPASDLLFPKSGGRAAVLQALDEAADQHGWQSRELLAVRERFATGQRYPGMEFMLPLLYGGRSGLQTLLDYLPPTASLMIYDPVAVRQRMRLVRDRIQANYQEAVERRLAALPPTELFVTEPEWEQLGQARLAARFSFLPDPDSAAPELRLATGDHSLLAQEIELQRKKRGILAPLVDRLDLWQQERERIVLACRSPRQARHLQDILANYQMRVQTFASPYNADEPPEPGLIACYEHPLSKGFDLPAEQVHFLSASELFGDKRLQSGRSRRKRGEEREPVQVDQLNQGDIVVHRDHGIGVFQGLVNMEFSGQRGDFMQIAFRDDDKLYVPVDRLHWVSRYQGLTDQEPKLDSLGSQRWQSAKKKVTEAVWKIAQELLEIYGRRALQQGHRFSPPGNLFQQLEESFPYDETSGQLKAIDDVVGDLTREQPMDRLICGDVGYGKTEVAARAAFKAIEDGYQVAILVPTTVLAEQHAATFRERFSSFPVEIACLNRFRTGKQQKEISAKLKAGGIDLVVGTHRLLSKDIQFKKLGLLVIDEEHRFGVAHKEKIKKIKATVDVLTLTATPIPRTLQMSLLGIRDLSVISTPPQQRRSVKTFLAKHDPLVIREAVTREMERGGQLFFVHNRVQSIHRMADTIASLVPQARIGVAHGQMPGQQLEDIMVRFINHELDVLVCTTIIESGLDIPNANTIIINRADHLGLADIYQLRGRVGRSSRQAYAYLLVASLDHLTADAQQRLRALMDCSELGGGFKLAMNDLQIRGGGNLLGVSQSGHIAAVGYDLYLELLQATVADLKSRALASGGVPPPTDEFDPEIKLKVAAFLPDSYIPDASQRYHAYRRLAVVGCGTEDELDDLRSELIDRYGPLPPEAANLTAIIGLKQRLRSLGIVKLEQGPNALVYSFVPDPPFDPARLLGLLPQKPEKKRGPAATSARLTPDQRLVVPLGLRDNVFTSIQSTLAFLQG
ncbi:transcription-repair coupling factor [Desulfobulbus sp.]|uniref:transcription-repair coupling factor n=1 Tax=Desulfobulbus sp. TaxID=895 RepID=UPI00286F9B81|nr:transcription-repair coupling factor [Desulfobulbus sp.]